MKTDMPDISVVIPTHLRPELLSRAVTSAFEQTSPPCEVIVVDDAKDASTAQLMNELSDRFGPALIFVHAEQSGTSGASASRNRGASVATGTVLAFLDDDDWWDKGYLSQACATLAATGADIVLTPSWMVVDESSEEWLDPSPASFTGFRPGISGSNLVISRTAFDVVGGFDPGMWVMNDVDFFVRAREHAVTMAAASDRLVFHEGRGAGHLMSPSERRAKGLEHFFAVHEARLDRSTKRLLKRRIHAARITPDAAEMSKLRHRLGVLWFSSPSDYRGTIARRLKGRRRAH